MGTFMRTLSALMNVIDKSFLAMTTIFSEQDYKDFSQNVFSIRRNNGK